MLELLSKINWSPLFISLKTGFVAIIFIFILGVIGAIAVMKMGNRRNFYYASCIASYSCRLFVVTCVQS